MFKIETLRSKTDAELNQISKDLNIKNPRNSTQDEKVFALLDFQASNTKQVLDYLKTTNAENTEKKEKVAEVTPAKKPAARKKLVAKKKVETETSTTETEELMPIANSPEVIVTETPVKSKRGRKPKTEEVEDKTETDINISTEEDKTSKLPLAKKTTSCKKSKSKPESDKER